MWLTGALGVLMTFAPLGAAEIGSPAPALEIGSWIKNGPVDLAAGKGKTIYVLEFWATWCGPCLESIPHLTELQKKYRDKGVVIVGISDEPASVVKPFVEKMGAKMDYVVAVDRREATSRNYMGAFQIEGIPHAFVIDKSGVIAWHGHPQAGLDSVLERMVAGKYDIKLARDEEAALKAMDEYFQLLERWNTTIDRQERAGIELQARQVGESVLAKAARSPSVLSEFASAIVLVPGTKWRDLELAGRAAESAYRASDKQPADKARKLMHDYFRTLRAAEQDKSPEKTQQLQQISKQILEEAGPDELKEFAWTIMAAPELEPRDLTLALKAADAARVKTKDQDATALDTYARALFQTGQREKAIEAARKAVQVNKDERLKPILENTLKEFERAGSGQPAAR